MNCPAQAPDVIVGKLNRKVIVISFKSTLGYCEGKTG